MNALQGLTPNLARKILTRINLPVAPEAYLKKSVRRKAIVNKNANAGHRQICAALEIQRIWRSYRVRCRLFSMIYTNVSLSSEYCTESDQDVRVRDISSLTDLRYERINQRYEEFCQSNPETIVSFEKFCVKKIEQWWLDKISKKTQQPLFKEPKVLVAAPDKKAAEIPAKAIMDYPSKVHHTLPARKKAKIPVLVQEGAPESDLPSRSSRLVTSPRTPLIPKAYHEGHPPTPVRSPDNLLQYFSFSRPRSSTSTSTTTTSAYSHGPEVSSRTSVSVDSQEASLRTPSMGKTLESSRESKYVDEFTTVGSSLEAFRGFFVQTDAISFDDLSTKYSKVCTQKDKSRKELAAEIIQRGWRGYVDRRVFCYFKQLLGFSMAGDPALMLALINPNEASLFDAAAGIHVRFRLAGANFPPSIYYKIFTHRPVVDVCASSPRDYYSAQRLQCKSESLFIQNKDNVYKRYENNGWRPIALSCPNAHYRQDYLITETSQHRAVFRHSKITRREDVLRRQKRRKIQWLTKLYNAGRLDTELKSMEPSMLDTAASNLLHQVLSNTLTGSTELDAEVDELLEWTSGLNYEDYTEYWAQLGTTEPSEVNAELRRFRSSNKHLQAAF